VRVLREGAISLDELATIVPELGEGHAATP
jgi:hypothetical protein